jgi:hypothetical protein
MTDERPSGTKIAAAQEALDGDVNSDFREFILTRELSEVFLLLDNLAADSDTTIAALAKQKPPEGLGDDWIQNICQIKWPPTTSEGAQAQQAALVIRAKDYLNGLAKPASGSTIAFTLLFTQRGPEASDPVDGPAPAEARSDLTARRNMAAEAYPEYIGEARRFQRFRFALWIALSIFLAVTCFVSWYVAYGNAALGEYATLKAQVEKAQERVDNDDAGRVTKPTTASSATHARSTATAAPEATAQHRVADAQPGPPEVAFCDRWKLFPRAQPGNLPRYESPEQRQACSELDQASRKLRDAEIRLHTWLGLWRWVLNVSPNENDASSVASRLTAVFGSAVLPVLYGLLGAGAAVLRNISRKITLSTLSPRDRNLSLLQLLLGTVTGACIGLFIVAPGKDTPLIGPVGLSGSAISFIAGFGVEAVFQALETLIARVFNISGVSAQTRSEARRPS